jgi:hypothetical protein
MSACGSPCSCRSPGQSRAGWGGLWWAPSPTEPHIPSFWAAPPHQVTTATLKQEPSRHLNSWACLLRTPRGVLLVLPEGAQATAYIPGLSRSSRPQEHPDLSTFALQASLKNPVSPPRPAHLVHIPPLACRGTAAQGSVP